MDILKELSFEKILLVCEMCSDVNAYFQKKYYKHITKYCSEYNIKIQIDKILELKHLKYKPCKYQKSEENNEDEVDELNYEEIEKLNEMKEFFTQKVYLKNCRNNQW